MAGWPQSWQLWAVLSAVFAAATAIFAKQGVRSIHPDVATYIRTLVIVAALSIVVLISRGKSVFSGISSRSWMFLTLSGLATGASWLCYFRALNIGQASQVAPIDKLSLVLVAIFAVLFLGERLTLWNWAGIGLIAVGAVLVSMKA